jgi:hypothetical protein
MPKKLTFIKIHLNDAIAIANLANILPEEVLGISGLESGWGDGRFAVEGNNFFSLHAPAPYETGTITAKGDAKVQVAKFASYLDSGKAFANSKKGHLIKGIKDPVHFATVLQKYCGFGWEPDPSDSKHKRYRPVANYVHDVSITINSIAAILKH